MRMKRSVLSAATAALLVAGATVSAVAAPAIAAPTVAAGPSGAGARHAAAVPLPVGFRPEGVASYGRVFFSGSVADGRIWRGDLRTGRGGVLVPAAPGRSLRGMQVDRRTGLLWTTGSEGSAGIVLAVDARTGRIVRSVEVPVRVSQRPRRHADHRVGHGLERRPAGRRPAHPFGPPHGRAGFASTP